MRHRTNIHELIERQCFLWREEALTHGFQSELAEDGPDGLQRFGPYVTVSREFGCDALGLADQLATRLDWQVYDRQIVDEIARDAHVTRTVVQSLDERAQNWLGEYIANLTFAQPFTEVEFHHHLVKVVTAIARHGKAVIVGRGANFFLPPEGGVRVRITAPIETRARWLESRHGMAHRDAMRRIRKEDSDRAAFVDHLFGRDIADPAEYDATYDVSAFPRETLVQEIIALLAPKPLVRSDATLAPEPPRPSGLSRAIEDR